MNKSEKTLLLLGLLLLNRKNKGVNKNIEVSFSYFKSLFPNNVELLILSSLWDLHEKASIELVSAHRDEKTILEEPVKNEPSSTRWQDLNLTLETSDRPRFKKIETQDYQLKTEKDILSLREKISQYPTGFYFKIKIDGESISSKLEKITDSWNEGNVIVSEKSGSPKWQKKEVSNQIAVLRKKYDDNRVVIEDTFNASIDLIFVLLSFEYSGSIKIKKITSSSLFEFKVLKNSNKFDLNRDKTGIFNGLVYIKGKNYGAPHSPEQEIRLEKILSLKENTPTKYSELLDDIADKDNSVYQWVRRTNKSLFKGKKIIHKDKYLVHWSLGE